MGEILFDNTEIAFKSKSKVELRKAYVLFKIISNGSLVKPGTSLLNFAKKIKFPVGWFLKPTVFKHFCGGESIEECQTTIDKLYKYSVKAILDYSVEGKESTEDFDAALQETLKTIHNAKKNSNIPYAVFKPTAFTYSTVLEKLSAEKKLTDEEKKEQTKFEERVEELCKTAHGEGVPIMIDAEDYAFQKAIDDVVTKMMEMYNKQKAIVYNTLQMYRVDRLDFLKQSYKKALEGNYYLGVKFVRGAYMDKERERAAKMKYLSPIHPDKEATDKAFNDALRFSIKHIDKISIFNATHNEESSQFLVTLMEEAGFAPNDERFYFSQLYGMSDHISFNLAKEGYNVAKYIPYGPVGNVLPYLMRRAEENVSVTGQTNRELRLIIKETQRRKHKGLSMHKG